ncbi:hypothetical protein [uncultured Methanomethylovorans sp.]|uniref:hypothetical protein n=1 Tax=uncultured Methanomethylovorans sp. TaxID=183759 RepID=UPI002604C947|nr:hypothetical protein [uncultured Methanomethylovorans sp.]
MQIASKYLYVKTKTGLSASQGWSTQMKTNTTIVSTISGLDTKNRYKDCEKPEAEHLRHTPKKVENEDCI